MEISYIRSVLDGGTQSHSAPLDFNRGFEVLPHVGRDLQESFYKELLKEQNDEQDDNG